MLEDCTCSDISKKTDCTCSDISKKSDPSLDESWRKPGKHFRARLLLKDGSNSFRISKECSIKRYYEVAHRVHQQFLHHAIDEREEKIEAYLIGSRLSQFLSSVLPTHPDYFSNSMELTLLREESQKQLVDLLQYIEEISNMIDQEEHEHYISKVLDKGKVPPPSVAEQKTQSSKGFRVQDEYLAGAIEVLLDTSRTQSSSNTSQAASFTDLSASAAASRPPHDTALEKRHESRSKKHLNDQRRAERQTLASPQEDWDKAWVQGHTNRKEYCAPNNWSRETEDLVPWNTSAATAFSVGSSQIQNNTVDKKESDSKPSYSAPRQSRHEKEDNIIVDFDPFKSAEEEDVDDLELFRASQQERILATMRHEQLALSELPRRETSKSETRDAPVDIDELDVLEEMRRKRDKKLFPDSPMRSHVTPTAQDAPKRLQPPPSQRKRSQDLVKAQPPSLAKRDEPRQPPPPPLPTKIEQRLQEAKHAKHGKSSPACVSQFPVWHDQEGSGLYSESAFRKLVFEEVDPDAEEMVDCFTGKRGGVRAPLKPFRSCVRCLLE